MLNKIIKEEGFFALYKGLTPSLILTFSPVIQFTLYEMLRKSFSNPNGEITNKNIIFISFISKIITIFLNYPLMTIKSMYQANTKSSNSLEKNNKNTFNIVMKMIKEESFFSLYKGLSSKVVGSLISNIILMLTYEKIQEIVRKILLKMFFEKK